MEAQEIFTVRRRLELSPEGEEKAYFTWIVKTDATTFTVAQPLTEGKALLLVPGQRVRGKAFTAGDQYVFLSRALQRLKEPLPAYVLALPQAVERVQARNYVRLQVMMEFYYHVLKEGEEWEAIRSLPFDRRGLTVDISGGGLQALLEEKLEVGALLAVWLSFQVRGRNVQLFSLASVVRCQETAARGRGRYRVAMQFLMLPEQERDKIISFVFQEMRHQRRWR